MPNLLTPVAALVAGIMLLGGGVGAQEQVTAVNMPDTTGGNQQSSCCHGGI